MQPATPFQRYCQQVAEALAPHGFKALQKGQKLKKPAADRDMSCEIFFQSSTLNSPSLVSVIPHVAVYSKQLKAWSAAQTGNPHATGVIIAEHLGYLTGLRRWKAWNLAGAGETVVAEEILGLLKDHVLPIFELFDSKPRAIAFLAANGTRFNPWAPPSLLPLDFMIRYADRADAERFFNDFIASCAYKKQILRLYQALPTRGTIDLNHAEFVHADKIKLGFVHGLRILDP